MPARTGDTVYVPGRGATTVKTGKKGKQLKTFQGPKKKAPAGATPIPVATAAHPNVSVPRRAAHVVAKIQARRKEIRRQAILAISAKPPVPKAPPRAPKPKPQVGAEGGSYVPPENLRKQIGGSKAELAKIQAQIKKDAIAFNAEGGKQIPVPGQKATKVSAKTGFGIPQPKLSKPLEHPVQAQKALHKVKAAKRALAKSGGTAPKTTEGKAGSALRRHGYTQVGAAGALGNAYGESGYDPGAEGSGGGGLFGFTAEPVSLANLQEYAASKGKDWRNPRVQVDFMDKHIDPGVKAELNAAKSPQEAATIFQEGFEKPEDRVASLGKRQEAAAKAYGQNFSEASPKALKNYKAAVKNAESLGLKVPNGAASKPSKRTVTRYRAGIVAAKELAHAKIPYIYGAGHGPEIETSPGALDCSGAVSWVLNKMGVLKGTANSTGLESVGLEPGPGAVSVYTNADHTFMSFGKRFWGTSVNDSSHGLGFYKKPSDEYLAAYKVWHVPGLGVKEAIQLGIVSSGAGLPQGSSDMQFSNGGTSATVTGGSTLNKPGFSNSPIKLTRVQQGRRKLKELADLGVGINADKHVAKASKVLADLERRYGSPVA